MDVDAEMTDASLEVVLRSTAPDALASWFRKENAPVSVLFSQFVPIPNIKAGDDSSEDTPYRNKRHLETASERNVGSTPLHLAVHKREELPDLLDCLLGFVNQSKQELATIGITDEDEFNWDVSDKHGFTPFTLAVSKDDDVAIRKLIAAGASIDSICDVTLSEDIHIVTNVLGLSAATKSMKALRALLGMGADHAEWDTAGMRPIHRAAQFGALDALYLLLELDGPLLPLSSQQIEDLYLVREDFENLYTDDEGDDSDDSSDDDDDDEDEEGMEAGEGERVEDTPGADESSSRESEFRGMGSEMQDDFVHIWTTSADSLSFDGGMGGDDDVDDHGSAGNDGLLDFHDILQLERELADAGFEIRRDRVGNITAQFTGRRGDGEMQTRRDDKDYGANLLHVAVKHKQYEIAHFLLTAGAKAQSINDRRGDGMTAMHIAACNNDTKILQLLIEEGRASVNSRNDVLGMLPIHLACENGAKDALTFLLKHGASPDSRDDNQFVPMHYAATSTSGTPCVESLVEAGAAPNAIANDGETPVYTAISRWNLPSFWKLIEAGGNPGIAHSDGTAVIGFIAANSMDELAKFANYVAGNASIKKAVDLDIVVGDEGQTALHIAAREKSAEAVESLLKAGASPDKPDENGCTPLLALLEETTPKRIPLIRMMTALIRAGADASRADSSSGSRPLHFVSKHGLHQVLKLMLEKGVDQNCTERSKTALHVAAEAGHERCMQILLSHGAPLDATDDDSMTPALICAKNHFAKGLQILADGGADLTKTTKDGSSCWHICSEKRGHAMGNVAKVLKASGVSFELLNNAGDQPLHVHIQKKRTEGVRALIQAGADLHSFAKNNQSPLMTACNKGHLEAIRLLLRGGVDINLQNCNKHTAIFYFPDDETATVRVLRLLLSANADIKHRDKDGDTVLHEAALGNNPTIVRFLIHRGMDINARNHVSETPLFQAAKRGFVETVKALLHENPAVKTADPKIPNRDGISPYQAAREGNHSDVMQLLLQAMKVTLSTFAPLSTYSIPSPMVSGSLPDIPSRSGSGRTRCAVCQDDLHFGEEVRRLPCGHEFHDPCILPWIGGEQMSHNPSCPVCKQPVAPSSL